VKYLYHKFMAAVLNGLASMGSYLMRNAGRASEYHEMMADVERLSR